jgi:hypothetical protein
MGPSGFISHLRELCAADFYRPEKSIALTGFESANFGSSGKHTNQNTTKATIRSETVHMSLVRILMAVCDISHELEGYLLF